MNKSVISLTKFAGLAVLAFSNTACEAEKSRNPLSPNVAGPIAGVSISAPVPTAPINGTEVLNTSPIRLTFSNSATNGERPLYYVVELAADAGFTNKLFANGRVPPGTGQTSVVVDGTLGADRTYFWRVKADDGANESAYSPTARFDLVVPIVIEAPTPTSPLNGQTVTTTTPTLTVTNGGVHGRAGRVEYWFEVGLDPSFARTLVQKPAERNPSGSTSAQMPELPGGTLLYWRAAGFNGTLTGAWSTVQSFRTPTVAPPPQPPPPPEVPPAPGCSAPGSPALWSSEQWRVCFFSLVQSRNAGPTVTQGGLSVLRNDLVARGADWQNGWRGDYRPRIFLPVPNCPPPSQPNPPGCAYSRTIDVGDYGGAWQWLDRGQTAR